MSTMNLIWIVVVIVAILVIALTTGLLLARKRRINLRSQEQAAPAEKPSAKGGYQAGGGFSFSSGGTAVQEPPAHPAGERTEVDGQPAVGDDAAVPRDAPRRGIVDVTLPAEPATGTDRPTATDTADTAAPSGPAAPAADGAGTATAEPAAPEPAATTAPATEAPAAEAARTEAPAAEAAPADTSTADTSTTVAPANGTAPAATAPSAETAEAAAATAPPAEDTRTAEAPAAPAAAPAVAPVEPVEDIAPPAGRLERLRGRLSRSRSALGQGLLGLLGAGDLDEDSWEEVEDTLLMADLGAALTTQVVERLRSELSTRAVRTAEDARAALRDVLVETLRPEMDRAVRALPHGDPGNGGRPAVVLVVGVNGTGKTTTTGKLARVLVADGRRLLLGAADTFRAAAVEQLATWAERAGAEVVRGKEKADPASVAFDAVKRGIDTHVDAVLVDTAGRLHTKTGLMDELGKVKRVVEKQAEVDEVLLVLDATTGQNGLTQARVFSDIVEVTGIVLTKLDGTAKGGIVFQVQRELGVPVKLVGLGEGPDDLAPFEPTAFVDALLG